MNKRTFIESYLKINNLPTKSANNKCIVTLISEGYKASGLSAQGASKITKRLFPDKKPVQPIFTHILILENMSYCAKCSNVKSREEFHSNNSSSTGVSSYCKSCVSIYRSNKVDTTYYNKKREQEIVRATPKWANHGLIKGIYKNCPEGYHVDHIYPINGAFCCGLHVENNLQYLLAKDNLTKSNKMPE